MNKGKMLKAPALVGAMLWALCAGIAQAEVFNFTLTGTPESASGTFTTNASGIVTAITGTMTGADKTTITAVDSSYNGPDNILGSASPYVDSDGISWDSADGAQWNLYYSGPAEGVDLSSFNVFESKVSFTVTPAAATPEPSSMLLMSGGGLLAFGIARKRRRVKVASSLS